MLAAVTGFSGIWRVAGLGWAVPRPVGDWLYNRVARNRYRLFGRHTACPLPEPALLARFVADGLN